MIAEQVPMRITELSSERREELLSGLREKYEAFRSSGISLDMSRGNPPREQLSLNSDILNAVTDPVAQVDRATAF